jgi:hypothetical protein
MESTVGRVNLTERRLRTVRPPATGRLELLDAVCPGLYFRMTDKGVRSWSMLYRFNQQLRRDTLGPYPKIGLAKARQLARDALELVGQGKDPRAQVAQQRAEEAQRAADTVDAVAERFIKLYASERRWADLERILRRELMPVWGDRPVAGITRKDAIELLTDIKERAPVRANRVLTVMKLFFGWCVENEYAQGSPVASIKPPTREKRRERILSEDEIRAF